jgi:hypothetical protein
MTPLDLSEYHDPPPAEQARRNQLRREITAWLDAMSSAALERVLVSTMAVLAEEPKR